MGLVMQEIVYFLSYILEDMHIMRSWVDIEVEKVCVMCVVRAVKVWITFCGFAQLILSTVHYILSNLKRFNGKSLSDLNAVILQIDHVSGDRALGELL